MPTASANGRGNSGRRPLGRGLAAMLARDSSVDSGTQQGDGALRHLAIERLRPGRGQPRKHFAPEALAELAESIRTQGLVQPLVVRKAGDDYEIVAGERRWRAAGLAGLREVPAIVRDLGDGRAMEVALVENIQRQDLDPIEEAHAYRRLTQEHHLSQEQVARAVGKSRVAVTNSLRLLQLPTRVLELMAEGSLTAGHARALMTLRDSADMVRLGQELASRRASVREAEGRARQIMAGRPRQGPPGARPPAGAPVSSDHRLLEGRLQRALGARVRIAHRRGRGSIRIDFSSLAGLDALLERLLGSD